MKSARPELQEWGTFMEGIGLSQSKTSIRRQANNERGKGVFQGLVLLIITNLMLSPPTSPTTIFSSTQDGVRKPYEKALRTPSPPPSLRGHFAGPRRSPPVLYPYARRPTRPYHSPRLRPGLLWPPRGGQAPYQALGHRPAPEFQLLGHKRGCRAIRCLEASSARAARTATMARRDKGDQGSSQSAW